MAGVRELLTVRACCGAWAKPRTPVQTPPALQNKLSKDFDDWLNTAMCDPSNAEEDAGGLTKRDSLLINWKSAPVCTSPATTNGFLS